MTDIIIDVTLPTTRQLGGALPVSEIRGYTLALSSDAGANFAPIGAEIAPDVLATPVNDLPPGNDYVVRGIVFDTNDQPSNPVVLPFVIADDSPPGDLAINVTFP